MKIPSPDRRAFLRNFGSTVALGLSPKQLRAASNKSDLVERPNVLFLAVDDLRPNLGCYGDSFAITPNIDRLGARGTRFARAYCQQAVCNPSRQSLMTGLRPDTIKVWDMTTHFRQTLPGTVTLPEHFKNHGYFAQSFGKIYHGQFPRGDPQSWSVPAQFQYTPKRDDYQLSKNHVSRRGEKGDAMEFVAASDDAYPDGQVAKSAMEVLERFSSGDHKRPFFLAVGMRKPHLPFTAPKRYHTAFDPAKAPLVVQPSPPRGAPKLALHNSVELRGYLDMPQSGPFTPTQIKELRIGYYAAMSYTDTQIGRVLDTLYRTGLDRTTLIVFWADHGYHLGEQGLWCKTTNYESDSRVPLMIVRPGHENGSSVSNALVELLDIYPALCDLCHLPLPKGLEGRSLRPGWMIRVIQVRLQPTASFLDHGFTTANQPSCAMPSARIRIDILNGENSVHKKSRAVSSSRWASL